MLSSDDDKSTKGRTKQAATEDGTPPINPEEADRLFSWLYALVVFDVLAIAVIENPSPGHLPQRTRPVPPFTTLTPPCEISDSCARGVKTKTDS